MVVLLILALAMFGVDSRSQTQSKLLSKMKTASKVIETPFVSEKLAELKRESASPKKWLRPDYKESSMYENPHHRFRFRAKVMHEAEFFGGLMDTIKSAASSVASFAGVVKQKARPVLSKAGGLISAAAVGVKNFAADFAARTPGWAAQVAKATGRAAMRAKAFANRNLPGVYQAVGVYSRKALDVVKRGAMSAGELASRLKIQSTKLAPVIKAGTVLKSSIQTGAQEAWDYKSPMAAAALAKIKARALAARDQAVLRSDSLRLTAAALASVPKAVPYTESAYSVGNGGFNALKNAARGGANYLQHVDYNGLKNQAVAGATRYGQAALDGAHKFGNLADQYLDKVLPALASNPAIRKAAEYAATAAGGIALEAQHYGQMLGNDQGRKMLAAQYERCFQHDATGFFICLVKGERGQDSAPVVAGSDSAGSDAACVSQPEREADEDVAVLDNSVASSEFDNSAAPSEFDNSATPAAPANFDDSVAPVEYAPIPIRDSETGYVVLEDPSTDRVTVTDDVSGKKTTYDDQAHTITTEYIAENTITTVNTDTGVTSVLDTETGDLTTFERDGSAVVTDAQSRDKTYYDASGRIITSDASAGTTYIEANEYSDSGIVQAMVNAIEPSFGFGASESHNPDLGELSLPVEPIARPATDAPEQEGHLLPVGSDSLNFDQSSLYAPPTVPETIVGGDSADLVDDVFRTFPTEAPQEELATEEPTISPESLVNSLNQDSITEVPSIGQPEQLDASPLLNADGNAVSPSLDQLIDSPSLSSVTDSLNDDE